MLLYPQEIEVEAISLEVSSPVNCLGFCIIAIGIVTPDAMRLYSKAHTQHYIKTAVVGDVSLYVGDICISGGRQMASATLISVGSYSLDIAKKILEELNIEANKIQRTKSYAYSKRLF